MNLTPGQALPEYRPPPIDLDDIRKLAQALNDPNPIHLDAEAARRVGLGDRPVNQGPMNLAYVVNMLALAAGDVWAVRRLKARFKSVAHAGDSVVAGGRVTAADDVAARCDVWLAHADGRIILEGEATLTNTRQG